MNQNADIVIQKQEQTRVQSIKTKETLEQLKDQSSFKFSTSHWDIIQNYTYITCLQKFKYIFESTLERRRVKVFKNLAKIIKTRSAHQIKSHHQKMIFRLKNVDAVIQYLRNQIVKVVVNKPDFIPIIDKINREAQGFFIDEPSAYNFDEGSQKKQQALIVCYKTKEHLNSQKNEVKVEEEPMIKICGQIKQQQKPVGPLENTMVKQQVKEEATKRIDEL